MTRIKTPSKAKEPVRLRERAIANGNKSLYLDIYSKGVRKTESLGLYIIPEHSPIDKIQNKKTREIAEKIKSERILAIQSYGISQFEKIKKIGISLVEWMKQYEEDNLNLSKSTIRGRRESRQRVEDYLDLTSYPSLRLVDVNEDFCKGFLTYLRTAPNKSCTVNPRTITNGNALHIQTCLNGALNKAVKDGLIARNPLLNLSSKEKFHPTESNIEFLTVEELKKAIDTPAKHEDTKKAFIFACLTGIRLSDVIALTWRKIEDAPNGKSKLVRTRMLKTQKWIDNPLSEEALKWLNPKDDPDEPIFHLYDPVNVEKHIKIWLAAAGIDRKITFHCSRHTFATTLISLGVDIYTVSKLLGHSKVTTTQIYAKVIDQHKKEAVSKLDSLFEQP